MSEENQELNEEEVNLNITSEPTPNQVIDTLADGTEIIGAVRTRSAILIWTDNALYSMSYIGGRFVFSFN